jgi:hypothetical protein
VTRRYDANVTAATPTAPAPRPGGRIPVLDALSPFARVAVLLTLGVSVAAIILDFGLHADHNLIFIVAAVTFASYRLVTEP